MVSCSHLALSIIIPVYNEVDNVTCLHREIVAVLSTLRCTYEIIFVDDGSQDGTRACLQRLMHSDPTLRLICHDRNYGQSAAIISGARMAQYPILVTLDGDGQNDPADILRMLEHLQDGVSVVLGHRVHRHDNRLRKCSTYIANRVRAWLLRDGCQDTGCGLKLFPREAFLALPHFNHVHRFLPALFKRAGLQMINVPVNHRPRLHGVSKYGVMNRLFVGIYDLLGVYWLLKRTCASEVCNDHD